jgi:hypothetical protein
MLDLVRVQDFRWDSGSTEPADEYTFLYGKRNENHDFGTVIFVHKGAVKRVELVSDRMPLIILRGCWSDIFVLNVHAPTGDRTDGMDSFDRELEQIFDEFPKYHMKTLLGDLNSKWAS